MYLDKTVSIERLMPTSGDSDKESYSAVGNYHAVKMNIQPASAELTAITEGAYGQTFQAFVTVSGLRIGDRVTVSGNGDKYIIKGINNHIWGPIPHLEVILFKGDN